jgi:hypothetical protein
MVVSFETDTGGVAANTFTAKASSASGNSHAGRRVQLFIQLLLNISSLQKYCGLSHVA